MNDIADTSVRIQTSAEDTSGVFKYDGWSAPYFYETDEQVTLFLMKNARQRAV